MIVYNDHLFLQCKSREELSNILLMHPDAHIANPKTPAEFEAVKRKFQQSYKSRSVYKDRSKIGLRYIVASYAVPAQNVLQVTFDTSRISSTVRLGQPTGMDANVAYHGTNTFVQTNYNFDSNDIIATCQCILTCINLAPILYPIEVVVDMPEIAGIIRAYSGKSWVIRELKRQLNQPGVWLSYREEIL